MQQQQSQKFSDLPPMRISRAHSLFSHLLIAFVGLAASVSLLVAIMTSLLHRFVLESMVPPDQLTTVRDQIITGLFIISLITIALSIAIAYVLTHHITKPLREVMQAIDRLAHDDITVALTVRRRDELGALANLFNTMVRKMREARTRNDALQRLKSQFISTAAHQLRTPLTGLRWSLHYIRDKGDSLSSAEQAQTIEQAATTTDNMMHMVDSLLNVSKVEEGKFGLSLRSVKLAELVKNIVHDYQTRARQSEVALQLVSQLDQRLAIVADPDYLRLVFTNLLDNALDYTPSGGRVTLTLKLTGNFVEAAVQDTGLGIPAADQPKIFTQFHRAENAKKKKTDGSGLGLFIARNIARRHGGELKFSSQEGKGSTFILTLPLHEELIPKTQSLADVLAEI
ncbi:MAG TPA: HAMP domain-containing sensor histidine kinase [Candidatus Andersenbacteria bacterium]|nr:HAMP domain-containing sensor histidine kinase [Candidatus Andersenbacteria bacterium]